MNRLRFRVWDKFDKEMLDVHGINYDAEGVWTKEMIDDESDGGFIYFSDIELIQSTGLFDKNCKEIFEGDIVKDTDGYVGYIAFLKQEMGYVIVYKTYDKRLGHRYRLDDGRLEILGNIYENPHLLGRTNL